MGTAGQSPSSSSEIGQECDSQGRRKTDVSPENDAKSELEYTDGDVGPIPIQVLTGAEGFFDDLAPLTLFEELVRGQVPERAMGETLIVVTPPDFDDILRIGQ